VGRGERQGKAGRQRRGELAEAGGCASTGDSTGKRSSGVAVGVEAGASATGKCRVAQRDVPGFGAGKRDRGDATPDFCYALEDQSTARPACRSQ
jgi:hypothetical protein